MRKLLLVLLTFATGPQTFACSDFMWQWSTNDWVTRPDEIYHGQVVSIRAPRRYVLDGETDPDMALVAFRGLSRRIEVKVFETLKGPKKTLVEATLQPCQGGLPQYFDHVILFRVGSIWHAKTLFGDQDPDDFARDVLEALSKRSEP